MTRTQGLHELDWLRIIAILILLGFHTGMIFVSWEWHIKSAINLLSLVVSVGLYHFLIRPFGLIRPLFSLKPKGVRQKLTGASAILRPEVQLASSIISSRMDR